MDLTSAQIATLERLLKAGFKFVTIEHVERYVGIAKDGFVALLNPAEGIVKIFGQVGYLLGNGIGMLTERGEGKVFVWKGQAVAATPELLASYNKFRTELKALLEVEA